MREEKGAMSQKVEGKDEMEHIVCHCRVGTVMNETMSGKTLCNNQRST